MCGWALLRPERRRQRLALRAAPRGARHVALLYLKASGELSTLVLFCGFNGGQLARVRADVHREVRALPRGVAAALHLAGERSLARVRAGVHREMAAHRR